jgi:hypothetical protein
MSRSSTYLLARDRAEALGLGRRLPFGRAPGRGVVGVPEELSAHRAATVTYD